MVSPRSARLISSCRSWADFARQVSALRTTKERGDAFELLTQLYLTYHPEFRSKLESVWLLQDVPAAIRRQLRLPSADEGIDLIAKTRKGRYWAIQAKYRSDRDKPLTTSNVAKFLSLAFTTCKGIEQGVIAHSSSKPIRKQSLIGDSLEIGLQRWLELTAEDWKGFAASLSGKTPKVTPRHPRPHQKAALAAARKNFRKDRATRGRLIMPCGTGKSLAAFFIADALKPRRVLVAVPSLVLIKQGLTDWAREYLARGVVPEWLVVCSDDTTGQVDQDEFVSSAYEAGLPTTTDPAEIKEFLTSPGKAPKIVFTTYQSSPVLAAVARKARAAFDFAVLDEAHKTVGDKDRQFATLLFDKNLKIAQRLFMTATERVLVGRNDDVLTMDDEAVYGRRFYEMTFKDAIEQKIISDYKVLTVSVSQSRIDQLIAENRLVSEKGGAPVDARSLAAGIALKRLYQRRGVKHAISFHRSIAAADNFREQQDRLNALSGLGPKAKNLHISSKLSAGERATLLGEFKEYKRSLMTNARCLTEGVDVPAIDCVLFADPKQSKIDIVQAAGRALRLSPGKTYGYILLPLVVPDGMNFDEFAETTEFRAIARTIAALSTQDQRIAEEFRAREKAERSSGGVVEIEGDIPIGMKIDFGDFAKAIEARVWERVGKVNWRPFSEAREFARSLGLKSQHEWNAFSKSDKRPPDMPGNPSKVYAGKGWTSWGDWLGTGYVYQGKRRYRRFTEARAYARSLGFKSRVEWNAFCKSGKTPANIPFAPQQVYAENGWAGWGDWLGTDTVATYHRVYRRFSLARKFAQSLGLKSQAEWKAFCKSGKLPAEIPAAPWIVYAKKGWVSWGDWLGTGAIAPWLRKYRRFSLARKFAQSLGLKSLAEWRSFCKSGNLPADIPAGASKKYADKGWVSWGDWLGTGTIAPRIRQYRQFDDARKFARSLRLKSRAEWAQLCKSGKLPADIPASPERTYADKGWAGVGDWLGTGTTATNFRTYRSFNAARKFARSLGLKSVSEWWAFCKAQARPSDIPASPNNIYAHEGWVSWTDWLGTDRKRRS